MKKTAVVAVCAVLFFAVAAVRSSPVAWERLAGRFRSQRAEADKDIDGDGVREHFVLRGGRMSVEKNGNILWKSPEGWLVDDFILADSNNDGIPDLNLSVWKQGSFGRLRPFWIQNDEEKLSSHFFIFDFKNGQIFPVWQSSALARPNCSLEIKSVSGQNILLATEGNYQAGAACLPGGVSAWQWNGWGFTQIWHKEI